MKKNKIKIAVEGKSFIGASTIKLTTKTYEIFEQGLKIRSRKKRVMKQLDKSGEVGAIFLEYKDKSKSEGLLKEIRRYQSSKDDFDTLADKIIRRIATECQRNKPYLYTNTVGEVLSQLEKNEIGIVTDFKGKKSEFFELMRSKGYHGRPEAYSIKGYQVDLIIHWLICANSLGLKTQFWVKGSDKHLLIL